MNDEVLYELGVDINSSLDFQDGDLNLSSYDNNLVQAVANRLNTDLNELDLFYEEYGSVLLHFLGWKGTDETISYIGAELDNVLQNEERLENWEHTIEYTGNGKIKINLTLYPNQSYSIDTTLEINENGVEVVE